ncbi:MAG: deoxyribonuclease IV [bacterium]
MSDLNMKINIPDGNLLGFHASIRGGMDRAVDRINKLGCSTGQIFTKSNRQWRARDLEKEEVDKFIQKKEKLSGPVLAHTSYLINPANYEKEGRKKSIEGLITELKRADKLKIPYLVLHPGLHKGEGEKRGIELIVKCLDEVFAKTPKVETKLLLENTAGQGTALGYRLEQLQTIRGQTKNPGRIAYCLDTCHLFAAGYPLAGEKDYEETMTKIENILEADMIKALHLNDALKARDSRVDRHCQIGEGEIGADGFQLLMNDNRWKDVPKILETPVENNEWEEYYGKNLKTLINYIHQTRRDVN